MNQHQTTTEEHISFEELYRRHATDLFLYVFHTLNHPKEVAEDITSEAFISLFEKWDEFKPKHYPAMVAYLRKTVRFLSYNYNRKEQHLPTVSLDEISDQGYRFDPLGDSIYEEHLKRIRQYTTSEEYQLFEDIVIRNYPLKKIAVSMNVSVGALKVRWFRLKKKLQHLI